MFFLVITPIGWALRLLGRDPLEHEFEERASTYWVKITDRDERAKHPPPGAEDRLMCFLKAARDFQDVHAIMCDKRLAFTTADAGEEEAHRAVLKLRVRSARARARSAKKDRICDAVAANHHV